MALYTSSYLKRLAANTNSSERTKLFTESRDVKTGFDIFLSHSYLDKDEVEGIYYELTKQGYSVYVDWIVDPHLDRDRVTKDTAEQVRNRLKTSRSLMLGISTAATLSKWMPWELGYADGMGRPCSIFPVSREQAAPKTFHRSEYLLLYPYVKRATVAYTEQAFVTESGNIYAEFRDFVKKNTRPEFQFKNIDAL